MSPHNNDTRYGLQGHSIVDTCDVSTEISPELINKQNTSILNTKHLVIEPI